MLLDVVQCPGQFPQQRIIQPQMITAQVRREPGLVPRTGAELFFLCLSCLVRSQATQSVLGAVGVSLGHSHVDTPREAQQSLGAWPGVLLLEKPQAFCKTLRMRGSYLKELRSAEMHLLNGVGWASHVQFLLGPLVQVATGGACLSLCEFLSLLLIPFGLLLWSCPLTIPRS